MDLLDKIDKGSYLDINDEEFMNLLRIDNKEGVFDKDIRKVVLLVFANEYLKNNSLKSFIKILVDCIPMGYIARVIIKLRNIR